MSDTDIAPCFQCQRFAVAPNGDVLILSEDVCLSIDGHTHALGYSTHFFPGTCICDTLDPSICQAVFGPSSSMFSAGGPFECFWYWKHDGLYLHRTNDEAKVLEGRMLGGVSEHRDGYALPAKRPGSTATVGNGDITRLSRPALVILESSHRVRLLDLVTWKLSTIVSLPRSSSPRLMYPGLSSTGPSPTFVPSDDHVLFESDDGVSHLDLASGQLIEGPKSLPSGSSYEYCLPIPSIADAPTYLLRFKGYSALMRFWNGQVETAPIVLHRGLSIAHSASSNLTALVSRFGDLPSVYEYLICKKTVEWEAQSTEFLPFCDFSSLLSNDLFPHDLVFNIKPQALKVSSNTLRIFHPALDTALLMKVVKKFPDASVDAFVRYLLGSPLKSDSKESYIIHTHAIAMYAAVGLGKERNFPFDDFFFFVLPNLPSSEACIMLNDIWNDVHTTWTQTDPLVQALALNVVAKCFEEFRMLLIANSSSRTVELAFAVHWIKDAMIRFPDSPLTPPGCRAHQVYEFDCTLSPPNLHLKGPTDFVLVLNLPDRRLAMLGDMRYLYIRWNWFKRLIDCGGVELKQTRVAEMPGWMKTVELAAILGYVHVGRYDGPMYRSEALNLMEHRHELELVGSDGTPHPTFTGLQDACIRLIFSKVTQENVLSQISSYHRLGEIVKVKELLMAIVSGTYTFKPMELFEELSIELLALLKEARSHWMLAQEVPKVAS